MVAMAPQFILRFNPCISSLLSPFKFQNSVAWRRLHSRYLSYPAEASDIEFDDLPCDGKTTEKDAALRVALSRLAGNFGQESKLSMQSFFGTRRAAVISTGSLRLDIALGTGGLPKGRIVEVYGKEASGKTTLALHIIKEAQKLGGYCAYLDVENAMNPLLAESIGVNTDNLLFSQPDCAENLLSMVDTLTNSGSIDVIVVDSVAALVPQRELDALDVVSSVDLQPKIMQKALRKICYSLSHSKTLIIFVNQVRSKPKGGLQFEEVTCGGNALPFYAAVRLQLIRKNLYKIGEKIKGLEICAKVVKNKLAPEMEAELKIEFGRGICCESEVLELGCEHGIILNEGGSYFIEGEVLNSKEEAEMFLAANHGVRDHVIQNLRSHLFDRDSQSRKVRNGRS